jgi:3-deoxy-D-manno-octulosonate 8-phosphate phosphatase (KDO 8-P phosphatase)
MDELTQRLQQIRLLLCDVDGILTDGTVLVSDGHEIKQFHVMDGIGIRLARESGLKVGWFSARPSPATTRRAHELKVDFLYQDRASKVQAIERILREAKCEWSEVCYMGDDIVDLGALRRAGVAACVPEGTPEALRLAHYVTKRPGGQGAVREVIELILKAQQKWEPLIKEYSA